MLVERFAERASLACIVDHDLDRTLRDAHAHRRERQSFDLEIAHHVGQSSAHLAEQVLARNAALVEDQLRHGRAAHAELVDVVRGREPRAAAIDDEGRDSAIDLGVHEEAIAFATIGDVGLGAVQDPVFAFEMRGGRHREDVGAGVGLGHSHAGDPFTAEGLVQIARSLFLVRTMIKVVHEEHRMREVCEAEAGIVFGELVMDDDGCHRVHSRTPVLRGDRDAQETELAELTEKRHVQNAFDIEFGGLGLDLPACEIGDRLAKHPMLVGRMEKEVRSGRMHRRVSTV